MKISENKFTFLGYCQPVLSMLLEIIFASHGNDFSIDIVCNMEHSEFESVPYMPSNNISNTIIYYTSWEKNKSRFCIGVSKPQSKLIVYEFFNKNFGILVNEYTKLIHPFSSVSNTTTISYGSVINPGVIIAPFSQIKNFVTINRSVSIGHHTVIEDFSTINPGSNIAGKCLIESGVTIGMGANIIDGLTIGRNSIIGAGSLVTKNIPPNVVAYGNPAKVIREINRA
ncbi:MAG: acetyltransferase [Lentisphaerota bacterium]